MFNTPFAHNIFDIDAHRRTPKYLQIVHAVTKAIKQGRYKKGDRIVSINQLSTECFLSRDTVQKAYDLLERDKIIEAVKGKGFYISRTDIVVPYRVLLIFNRLSYHKKMIYDAFVQTLGAKATVELKIHHSSVPLLKDMIESSAGLFDYYVIMPHFYSDDEAVCDLLNSIPQGQLMLLDKFLPSCVYADSAVYQDFESDITEALESGLQALKKYNKLIYVAPFSTPHPGEIQLGFRKFCVRHQFSYSIKKSIAPEEALQKGEAYIIIEEADLVQLVKNCRRLGLKEGKDIGIISYNETPLKEILLDGISVISTDHAQMGETAAKLILERRTGKIKNPFTLTMRNSL